MFLRVIEDKVLLLVSSAMARTVHKEERLCAIGIVVFLRFLELCLEGLLQVVVDLLCLSIMNRHDLSVRDSQLFGNFLCLFRIFRGLCDVCHLAAILRNLSQFRVVILVEDQRRLEVEGSFALRQCIDLDLQ